MLDLNAAGPQQEQPGYRPTNARKDFEFEINNTDDFEQLTEKIFLRIKKSNQTEAAKYHLYKKIAKKADVPVKTLMDLDKKKEKSGPGNQIAIVKKIIEERGAENILHALGFVWMWYDLESGNSWMIER